MKKPSFLEPALLRSTKDDLGRTHWFAWDETGKTIFVGTGDFALANAMLTARGYVQVSPNSTIAMDIRNRLRDLHNL